MSSPPSVMNEMREIQLAIELIGYDARMQVLEAETSLSRKKLDALFREITGRSPSKGLLPFSADWFLMWQPNVHASLYVDIYRYLVANTRARGIVAITKAYKLYLEHMRVHGQEPILSITRAWIMVRYLGVMLDTAPCQRCGGHFVVHKMDLHDDFTCGLCKPPSRAGKSARAQAAQLEAAVVQARASLGTPPAAEKHVPQGLEKMAQKVARQTTRQAAQGAALDLTRDAVE